MSGLDTLTAQFGTNFSPKPASKASCCPCVGSRRCAGSPEALLIPESETRIHKANLSRAVVLAYHWTLRMWLKKVVSTAPPAPPPPTPTATIGCKSSHGPGWTIRPLSPGDQNATDVRIEPLGTVEANGSKEVSPADSTTYRLTAKGPVGLLRCVGSGYGDDGCGRVFDTCGRRSASLARGEAGRVF